MTERPLWFHSIICCLIFFDDTSCCSWPYTKNFDSIFDFLCNNSEYRSNTSVCIKFKNEEIANKGEEWQRIFAKEIGLILEKEEVAFDIVNHRSAPPGLRIWTGATVESSDVGKLLPWIDWAYKQALTNINSN